MQIKTRKMNKHMLTVWLLGFTSAAAVTFDDLVYKAQKQVIVIILAHIITLKHYSVLTQI